MTVYGRKNKRSYRYILIVIDNFIKIGYGVPVKIKAAQTKTNNFSNIIQQPNRKLNFIETDDGEDFVKKNFYRRLKQK